MPGTFTSWASARKSLRLGTPQLEALQPSGCGSRICIINGLSPLVRTGRLTPQCPGTVSLCKSTLAIRRAGGSCAQLLGLASSSGSRCPSASVRSEPGASTLLGLKSPGPARTASELLNPNGSSSRRPVSHAPTLPSAKRRSRAKAAPSVSVKGPAPLGDAKSVGTAALLGLGPTDTPDALAEY